jgi:LPXTG-motif cell wall-anchored protein
MRRLAYMVSLALVAVLVLAPGATAQQMNGKHMMPDGTMMDDSQMMGGNTMASPSASASATPSASDNGRKMGGTTMMSTSASASASSSASATPTATATASAPQSHHHHGGGGSSVSAAVDGQLPDTGGASVGLLVSVGALVLLGGFGLAATRLLRRST